MVEMNERSSDNCKVIKMFCVVGLNENKLTKYKEEDNIQIKYLQNIDIVKKNIMINCDKIEKDNTKWLILSKKNNQWLRIGYSKKYDNPITFLKIIECILDPYDADYLLINRSYVDSGYRPIKVNDYNKVKDFPEKVIYNLLKEFNDLIEYDNNYYRIPAEYNIKEILLTNSKTKVGVLAISRAKNKIALKDVFLAPHFSNSNTQKIAIIQSIPHYKISQRSL